MKKDNLKRVRCVRWSLCSYRDSRITVKGKSVLACLYNQGAECTHTNTELNKDNIRYVLEGHVYPKGSEDYERAVDGFRRNFPELVKSMGY